MNLKHLTFNKIFLEEVDSTNSFLIDLNKHNKQVNGSVVVANYQNNGKGQRGNRWISQKGENLTCSILLYPNIDVSYAFYLNIISSLAVNKTLQDLKLNSKIKWPNDILINTKKISGILVENILSTSKITQSIVGIGLNVNQTDFKDELKATSLAIEKINIDKEEVLQQIYQYLDFYYNILIQSNFDLLLKLYYKELLWYNETGTFIETATNQKINAKIKGVDIDGKLILMDTKTLQQKHFDLKEIKFLTNPLY
jgi:BirA family biotin operon repressor/biotin-[acetyl-CoA-carboxylase] ligase